MQKSKLAPPDGLKALKNQPFQPDGWNWLVQINAPNGTPMMTPEGEQAVVRLTDASEPYTWSSDPTGTQHLWRPWPLEIETIDTDAEGSTRGLMIKLGNSARTLTRAVIANNYLRGFEVVLYILNRGQVNTPGAFWKYETTIVDASIDGPSVSLELSSRDLAEQEIPQYSFGPQCRFTYRDGRCGFIGDPDNVELGTCGLLLTDCRLRGDWEVANGLEKIHPRRFGNAPNMPRGPVSARAL